MLFYPQEKLALFIDGANLYGAAKGLQFDIDYKRLLELFAKIQFLHRLSLIFRSHSMPYSRL